MKQIQYSNVEFQVQDGPEGHKILAIAEPAVATVHVFLLDQSLADSIAAALKGEQQPQIVVPQKPKLVVPNAA